MHCIERERKQNENEKKIKLKQPLKWMGNHALILTHPIKATTEKKHTQTHTKIPHIPVHITDILYILIKTAMHKKEEKKIESVHLKQDKKKCISSVWYACRRAKEKN